ncbi:NADPH-dependent FMN reductase [Pseudoalteromonas sp. NBT06-2]|uniref:NADPH-dependent FMN reductase n=1 Tax=Pseudoalteromonas sp. NBT06-2 TaxID=2025950 RepID=UPI000BA542CE|nr:NAD(P)H-dependent oxidoreductase [Pseudoalteromonas sp. NBT06-2]PAJ71904.1 NADPH-dependent FMN reductase [Pseudoalteromonas sp. NBT06-2]
MKILTFAATNSRKSINKHLVKLAASKLSHTEIDYVEINDFDLPIYNIDLEEEYGIPNSAHAFAKRIKQADAILISFAEHNGNFTVAFKNLFDWLSRIDRNVYQGKPTIMLSTSPGAGGGKTVLGLAENGAPHFDGKVVGSLSIPSFYENFDIDSNQLTNPELTEKLENVLSVFQKDLRVNKRFN